MQSFGWTTVEDTYPSSYSIVSLSIYFQGKQGSTCREGVMEHNSVKIIRWAWSGPISAGKTDSLFRNFIQLGLFDKWKCFVVQPCKLLRDFKNKQIQEKALWLILSAWYFLECVDGRRQIPFLVVMNPAISGMSLTGPHYKKTFREVSPWVCIPEESRSSPEHNSHRPNSFLSPCPSCWESSSRAPMQPAFPRPLVPLGPSKDPGQHTRWCVSLSETPREGWTEARWGDFCKKTACQPMNLMEGGNHVLLLLFFNQPL